MNLPGVNGKTVLSRHVSPVCKSMSLMPFLSFGGRSKLEHLEDKTQTFLTLTKLQRCCDIFLGIEGTKYNLHSFVLGCFYVGPTLDDCCVALNGTIVDTLPSYSAAAFYKITGITSRD